MAIDFTPQSIGSGYQSTETLNENFESLEDLLQRALSRYGDDPNGMEDDLDMQAHRIFNLPAATANGEPVTYQQFMAQLTTTTFTGCASEVFTATDGQTAFNFGSITYTPGLGGLWVFVNGIRITDFTETDTNTFTLSSPAVEDDEVEGVVLSFEAA